MLLSLFDQAKDFLFLTSDIALIIKRPTKLFFMDYPHVYYFVLEGF